MVPRTAKSETLWWSPSNEYLMSLPGDSGAHWKLENCCTKAWNSFAFLGEKKKIYPIKVKFLPSYAEKRQLIILSHATSLSCPSLLVLAEYILSDPVHAFSSSNQTLSVLCHSFWVINSQNTMPSFTSLLILPGMNFQMIFTLCQQVEDVQ